MKRYVAAVFTVAALITAITMSDGSASDYPPSPPPTSATSSTAPSYWANAASHPMKVVAVIAVIAVFTAGAALQARFDRDALRYYDETIRRRRR